MVSLGHVVTHWDPDSRSVINVTLDGHVFKNGIVVRQILVVGNTVYSTTFGEGNNSNQFYAYLNGTFGPGGFTYSDNAMSQYLSRLPGFLNNSTTVFGTVSTYIGTAPLQ